MGISIYSAQTQANSLRAQSSTLIEVANGLQGEKGDLNLAWQASEMKYVNTAIEQIVNELRSLSSELDAIAGSVVEIAYQIKDEEDRAAAAAAEAQRLREALEAQERAKVASKKYYL